MLSDNCLCVLAERHGAGGRREEEGGKRERERALTEKAKQTDTMVSPFPGRTVSDLGELGWQDIKDFQGVFYLDSDLAGTRLRVTVYDY